jgi:hypothetical protein
LGTADFKFSTSLGVLSDPNSTLDNWGSPSSSEDPLFRPSPALNSTSSPVSEEQAKSFLDQINSPDTSSSNPPEQNPLQLTNLAALDIWKSSIEEGEKSDNEATQGYWNQFKEAVETSFNGRGKTERDDSVRGWANERALVGEIEKLLKDGTTSTIHSALYLIETGAVSLPEKGAAHIRERARAYLGYDKHSDPGLITRLIRYANEAAPDSAHAKSLLEETFSNLESKDSAVQTAFAIYSLVSHLSPEAEIQQATQGHLNALQGHSSFKRAAEKFLYSLSPTEVAVNVGLMFVSGGLGNLAKLLAMKKFEQAGVVGLKAIAGATAAGFATETASLGTFNNLQQVLTHDPSKMTAKDIANNYKKAASMIGFTKLFGNIGEIAAPGFAKALGLATEEGLTLGGKALSWGVGHTAGLGGMVASSRFNQARGWQQGPVGGENEALVNDFLGYVEFAGAQGLAHSAVDAVTQGKLSEFQQRQHQEIIERRAKLISQIPTRLSPAMAAMSAGATVLLAPELAHAAVHAAEASSEGNSSGLLAGITTLTLGGLAMAAAKKGKSSSLIKEQKAKLEEIYREVPKLKNSLAKTRWSSEQKYQLLTLLAEKAGVNVRGALWDLHHALEGLRDTGWTSEQKYQLLTLLAEKTGENDRDVYLNLPEALYRLDNAGWTSEQKYQLLTFLAEKAGVNVGDAYLNPHEALQGLRDTGSTPEQKHQDPTLLAKIPSEWISILQTQLTPDQGQKDLSPQEGSLRWPEQWKKWELIRDSNEFWRESVREFFRPLVASNHPILRPILKDSFEDLNKLNVNQITDRMNIARLVSYLYFSEFAKKIGESEISVFFSEFFLPKYPWIKRVIPNEKISTFFKTLGLIVKHDSEPYRRFFAFQLITRMAQDSEIFRNQPQVRSLMLKGMKDPEPLVLLGAWGLYDIYPIRDKINEVEISSEELPGIRGPSYPSSVYFYPPGIRHLARLRVVYSMLDDLESSSKSLPLKQVQPIHSLADFNPEPSKRKMITEEKYEKVLSALKDSDGEKSRFFSKYFDGEDSNGYTKILELSSGEFYVFDGHHRLSALFLAASRGDLPSQWLSEPIPFNLVKYHGPIPKPVIRRALTMGVKLSWRDLFPHAGEMTIWQNFDP